MMYAVSCASLSALVALAMANASVTVAVDNASMTIDSDASDRLRRWCRSSEVLSVVTEPSCAALVAPALMATAKASATVDCEDRVRCCELRKSSRERRWWQWQHWH